VLEQLILRGALSYERLQGLAKMRRSDDEFGLVLGDLAEKRGKSMPRKLVMWWHEHDTRMYAIRPEMVAKKATKR
jgi:hypothetical protein